MKNILVPIDFSDMTSLLLDRATALAQAFGSTVRLVHVAAPDPPFVGSRSWPEEVRDEMAKELRTEHHRLNELAETLKRQDIDAKAIMVKGHVADVILEQAQRVETDLILFGLRHQSSFHPILPGSMVHKLLHQSSCPVLVVPEPEDAHRS